jgi:phosphoribosylformimino-5-aminoimidazole carboxamide ribotide isomerase
MMAIPAVDLRDGKCVQLVGGSYERERVRLDDPIEVARGWVRLGFSRLHVVDLDAATGRGSNASLIRDLLQDVDADVQVGGGVRSVEQIDQLLAAGAQRVVVGTRAIEEPAWLEDAAATFPGQLIVAADVRNRRVVTRGWSRNLSRDVLALVDELDEHPLAGILVTAVHREGQMTGADLFLMEDVAESTSCPVIASGGIATMHDLRELAERGVAAAVLGMALYTGALDPHLLVEEFPA